MAAGVQIELPAARAFLQYLHSACVPSIIIRYLSSSSVADFRIASGLIVKDMAMPTGISFRSMFSHPV